MSIYFYELDPIGFCIEIYDDDDPEAVITLFSYDENLSLYALHRCTLASA
jgi:hypothetical protein